MKYKISGIIILAVFYSCYFFKMLTQKRKGIKTDHMGKDTEGKEKLIELVLKTMSIVVPLTEVISIVLNTHGNSNLLRIDGLFIGGIGDFIFVVSVVTMRDSWRAGISKEEKTAMVTDGIYGYSRNPAFLGFDLVYIGILLCFFNWALFLVSASAIMMFHLQITMVEEPFLRLAFKEEYNIYCDKVHRYIGKK